MRDTIGHVALAAALTVGLFGVWLVALILFDHKPLPGQVMYIASGVVIAHLANLITSELRGGR